MAQNGPEFVDFAALASRIVGSSPGSASEHETRLCGILGRRIRLYGLRHLRDPDRADELVQVVLTRALEQLRGGGIREPDQLISYVLGTSRNTVFDLRRAERRERRALDRLSRSWPAATNATETSAAEEPDRDRLGDCLAELAERERVVVTLTFYADRSAAEIADELTLSAGNVRVIRHRALSRLRTCLSTDHSTGEHR